MDFWKCADVDLVSAAILGASIILIIGVVPWKECIYESISWDTLAWAGVLVAMVRYLNKYNHIY